jgi:hypothetical protein
MGILCYPRLAIVFTNEITTATSLPQASEALTICCVWKIVRMTLGARLNPMEV